MKNLVKFIGIIALAAVIGFSMTACAGTGSSVSNVPAATQGILTITGLDEYNGLFVQARSDSAPIIAAPSIVGPTNPFEQPQVSGGIVKDGSVSLLVWEIVGTDFVAEDIWDLSAEDFVRTYDIVKYTGSGNMELEVLIWQDNDTYHWHYGAGRGSVTVTFNNGTANGAYVKAEN